MRASARGGQIGPQPTDFVELQRNSCLGSCPVYTVQIHADGQDQREIRGRGVSGQHVTAPEKTFRMESRIANEPDGMGRNVTYFGLAERVLGMTCAVIQNPGRF